MSEAKNRLATAFANIGLDKTRKQLDAIKTRPQQPDTKKREEKDPKKPTIAKKTIVEKTIVNPTTVKTTMDKKTMVKTAIAKSTIVEKTTDKEQGNNSTPPKKPLPSPTLPQAEQTKTIVKTTIVPEVKKEKQQDNNTARTEAPTKAQSTTWNQDALWDLIDKEFGNHSPNEITAFMTLLRESLGRNSTETGFISLNELSKRTGINRKSLPVAMEALQKAGLATMIETSAKQGNKYRIRGSANKG